MKPVGQLFQLISLLLFNFLVALILKVVHAFLKCVIHKELKPFWVVNRGDIFLSLTLNDLVFKHISHLTLNNEVDPIIELKALRDCVRIYQQPLRDNRLSPNLDFRGQDLFLKEDRFQQEKDQVWSFHEPQF